MYVRARRLTALVLAVLVCTSAMVTSALAASSPQGDSAAAWPSSFRGYRLDTGAPIVDVEGESGISPDDIDISSDVNVNSSVLLASDGVNAFFRIRVKGNPSDPSKGGFSSSFWLAQIAVGGVVKAVTGVNGKDSHTDQVYVSDAPGGSVTSIYETPFDNTGGQTS